MADFLDFKPAKCKDCYRCLRECPVKAIDIHDHQAKIIADRCILCGHCTLVCPQNAKVVHSEIEKIEALLSTKGVEVIASVAPSFVSSFAVGDFETFAAALGALSFDYAEETAVGAREVTRRYHNLLESGRYRNLISSACPAVCRMIQLYYHDAIEFLAPVDSPMIAHAKMLRRDHPDAKIVFIGPCIAKKREAVESGLIDGVLTFEELKGLLEKHNIEFQSPANKVKSERPTEISLGKAKYYPIRRGIIKSFESYLGNYEYVAVDGPDKCAETLSNIGSLEGFFLEMNSCVEGCINGPCSMTPYGKRISAMADVRAYVKRQTGSAVADSATDGGTLDIATMYPRLKDSMKIPSDEEIRRILARTGKTTPEDELDCGACGYSTCREKAIAVYNGYVDIDVCVPYMRERAESMSYEVIQNSPYGIVVMDKEFNITEINSAARRLLGIGEADDVRMRQASDLFDTTNFVITMSKQSNQSFQRLFVPQTSSYINQTISLLKDKQMLFSVLTDITEEVKYNERLSKVKNDTLEVTDKVIKKQMRVAQEIASLLGETTAETKVALLKLKQTLQQEEKDEL